MDIIRFAMQMELDGQKFYEQAAAESQQEGLKEIFLYLAEEEKRHFRFFKSLAAGQSDEARRELSNGRMKESRNVFVDLIENGTSSSFGEDVRAAWKKALEIEEQAVKLYSEEAKREDDSARKDLLNQIAEEERNHVYLIDNVLSYLNDPESFKASQQFSAFKSWEGR